MGTYCDKDKFPDVESRKLALNSKTNSSTCLFIVCCVSLCLIGAWLVLYFVQPAGAAIPQSSVPVAKRTILVEVKTTGELEAARSTAIASSIKGDQGKIIELIADGLYVQPGELLVRLDPTPFEEKMEKLRARIKEQENYIASLQQALEWERVQAEHKHLMSLFEVEAAQLELDKVAHGDGPQEILRLKGAMQKAQIKYEELQAYSQDLAELEAEGWLNNAEGKQARKKLADEREAYEMAAQQYASYVDRVYPMQIKKAESQLKRVQAAQKEMEQSGRYAEAKALDLLNRAEEELHDAHTLLREAKEEWRATEMRAPAPGMVVHREEYRSGQRRKPRVGDIVVKNQPLIDLPDLGSLFVKTRVREVDLFKIALGKPATIEVDAYPQLAFEGVVSSIGVLALSDGSRSNEEKYFEVHLSLSRGDFRLRPGMTVRITLYSEQASDVLSIPIHAVFEERGASYCYVQNGAHRCEKRPIELGISNAQWAEVKQGLREGEEIFPQLYELPQ